MKNRILILLGFVWLSNHVTAQLCGRYDYISVPVSKANSEIRHFHLSLSLLSNNMYIMAIGQIGGNHLMREISAGTFDMYYDTLRLSESNDNYQMKYVIRHDSLIPVHTFSGISDLALVAEKNTNNWWEDTWEKQVQHIKKPNRFHVASPFPIKATGVFGYRNFHQLVLKEDHTYCFTWRGYLISEGTWKRKLNRITLMDSVLGAYVKCVICKHKEVVRLIIPYYEDLVLFDGIDAPSQTEKLINSKECKSP